jgi:hypothetical protein
MNKKEQQEEPNTKVKEIKLMGLHVTRANKKSLFLLRIQFNEEIAML